MAQNSTGQVARALRPEEFRDVIGRFASGVTVITTDLDGAPRGTTASAVSSLSMDPPMVLVCMNESSSTGQAIALRRAFAINILGEDQKQLALHFASKSADKFASAATRKGANGLPLLDDALATLECRVVETVRGGTHTVFLAEVDGATARTGAPLAYFRGQFGRLEITDDHGAYDAIREQILDGRIPPGGVLDGQRLVDSLGLPAGALQIALGKLVLEGLVVQNSDGLQVRAVTISDLNQALQARCIIELGVIDRLIDGLQESDLQKLRKAQEAWTPVQEGAPVGWEGRHAQSMDFHDTLVSLAAIPALLDSYRQLAVPSLLARAFRGYALSQRDEAYGQDHSRIVQALADGDRAKARTYAIEHAERVIAGASAILAR